VLINGGQVTFLLPLYFSTMLNSNFQQQRQKAQEQQLTPVVPDLRLSADLPPASATTDFPAEKPCFTISQVVLSGADALHFSTELVTVSVINKLLYQWKGTMTPADFSELTQRRLLLFCPFSPV